MASRDELKRNAAEAALAYVKPGMILGLGTGSTARHFLAGVARLVAGGMDIKGVPTSLATAEEAKRLGIPLTSLEESLWLHLTGDGAGADHPKPARIKGLVGHGLFLKMAHAVLVASQMGVRTLEPTRTT